jgi:hypothetical protein
MIAGDRDQMQLSSLLRSLHSRELENDQSLSTCKLRCTFDSVLRHRHLHSLRMMNSISASYQPQIIPETGSLARKVGDASGGKSGPLGTIRNEKPHWLSASG